MRVRTLGRTLERLEDDLSAREVPIPPEINARLWEATRPPEYPGR
jgi:hypothetical protein